MLINLTNHPGKTWGSRQKAEAERLFGEVVDLPFPPVDALASEDDVEKMAQEIQKKVLLMAEGECSVLVQGEFTLTLATVRRLNECNIPCYAACSDRKVTEYTDENGAGHKQVIYEFVRFRRYLM